MAWSAPSWPPGRGDFFITPSGHRPFSQGDVFKDVLVPLSEKASPENAAPKPRVESRTVVIYNYPCDIYTDGKLNPLLSVYLVRTGAQAGVPEDWFQRKTPYGAFKACPFPDLFSDGQLHAADFRFSTNVAAPYLTLDKRVAAMTEYGLCYFRQRMVLSLTRGIASIEKLRELHRSTWDEMELWEYWGSEGLPADEYQDWLDEMHVGIGMTPRRALDNGETDVVREAIKAVIAARLKK